MTNPVGKTLIDCHVHLAALPDGDNGCYMSTKTLRSRLFRFLFWTHGLLPDKPREPNRKYLAGLLPKWRAARHVQKAVIRMGMLLHLRKYPEVHEHLLFGTDYPLSVFHTAAWSRVALSTLRKMITTKNHFDRQVEVCHGLKLSFRSLEDLLPYSAATTFR